MVIGDFIGYSSAGLGSYRPPKAPAQEQQAVTLDAQLDPKAPNEYSVAVPTKVIPPPERPSDAKAPEKRTSQSNDPVSRAFLNVANYQTRIYRIDVEV